MTTKELQRVLHCLEMAKKPNPFIDEAIAYVKKDLAIREQQCNNMRNMNRSDNDSEKLWY